MQNNRLKRVKEEGFLAKAAKLVRDYPFTESFIVVMLFFVIGYLVDEKDICMLDKNSSYILVLLAIITLFHGFESGIFSLGIIAVVTWFFYPSFRYEEFLVALMMTLIFSEYHYYWTKRIKEAEINSDYRGVKLDELTKAFYALKISHDQLEKNYVVKPMSLRNSIVKIKEESSSANDFYKSFLKLLEKSFNVGSAQIISRGFEDEDFELSATNDENGDNLFDMKDLMIDKVLERKKPIFINDEINNTSSYIAVIPALEHDHVLSLLLIKKMPFMAFNRENLTTISILFEYFLSEVRKQVQLRNISELSIIGDENFKFEYIRLLDLYKTYKVDSVTINLKMRDELVAERVYSITKRVLRSLDMVTFVKHTNTFYLIILFPFADEAAARGFLNRLLGMVDDFSTQDFEFMTFGLAQTHLFERYISQDSEALSEEAS